MKCDLGGNKNRTEKRPTSWQCPGKSTVVVINIVVVVVLFVVLAEATATAKAADKQFVGLRLGFRLALRHSGRGQASKLTCIRFMNTVLTASVQPQKCEPLAQRLELWTTIAKLLFNAIFPSIYSLLLAADCCPWKWAPLKFFISCCLFGATQNFNCLTVLILANFVYIRLIWQKSNKCCHFFHVKVKQIFNIINWLLVCKWSLEFCRDFYNRLL